MSENKASKEKQNTTKELGDAHIRRLRPHRLKTSDVVSSTVWATWEHTEAGCIQAQVVDLSLHGAGLTLPAQEGESLFVLAGDRLETLRIEWEGLLLYEGSAQVMRIKENEGELIIGTELELKGSNLDLLYQRGRQRSFAERFALATREPEHVVSSEFRGWVHRIADELERTKAFLDTEEAALAGHDRDSREAALNNYIEEVAPIMTKRMTEVRNELNALVQDLPESLHDVYRLVFRRALLPYVRHAPFMRRAYEKPLGYAGDYEMMNMLYRDHAEGASLFGKLLNLYVTQEATAQSVINRPKFLGDKILAALQRCKNPRLRVASLGCGPAREIVRLLELHPEVGTRLDVVLIDQEQKVFEYGQRTLVPLAKKTGAKVNFIDESIRRLVRAKRLSIALGERDFIYSAGLFDYLNDTLFRSLLKAVYNATVDGGEISIGNVALNNPTRWWMEYATEWFLIHRTEDELASLAACLLPSPHRMHVESESTGVNLFLSIQK